MPATYGDEFAARVYGDASAAGTASCVSPARASPLTLAVELSLNSQQYTADATPYVFYEEAVLSALWPLSGPQDGGTAMVINASHLANGSDSRCRFFGRTPPERHGAWADAELGGESPATFDVANGLAYTGTWSADGSSYTLQLQCPVPAGTPTAAAANLYAGAAPVPYLVGNNTRTPPLTYEAYEIAVARMRVGVTRVRLRADVRNLARNLRQPLLTGEFGSVDEPYIVSYAASNYENADATYGAGDLLTISFDKPTNKAGGERYGLKSCA